MILKVPRRTLNPKFIPWMVFAGLFLAFNTIYAPFVLLPGDRLGHDYSYFLPGLLDGKIWFKNNGFVQPWFTPSFCAGQPAFADPQSSYYGILQLVDLLSSPLVAIYSLVLLTTTLAYWGGYLTMHRVFRSGRDSAILVGGLLMFNGFLPHRLMVGHPAYHGFALVPWLFLLLAMEVRSRERGRVAATVAGLLIAYWIYAGFGILLGVGLLATALLALLRGLLGGALRPILHRGAIALAVGLSLAAGKLCATYSYLSHFPRNDYALPGASSALNTLIVASEALFLPSQWARTYGLPRMTNIEWKLGPHEWAYNFCTVLPLVALGLLIVRLRRGAERRPADARTWATRAVLFFLLLWPLAFNTYGPTWTAWLKQIPILSSTSTPMRWLAAYIPIIAVSLGLLLDKTVSRRLATLLTVLVLLATLGESAVEPRQYYLSQPYDVYTIQVADRRLRDGEWNPVITAVAPEASLQVGKETLPLRLNDTFLAGVSGVPCYNPVFGYNLESFSVDNLHPGPVLDARDGHLNLKNPACYVFPSENHCQPGDTFRADQANDAERFTHYRSFAFQISRAQAVANRVSHLALVAIVLGTLVVLARSGRRFFHRRDQHLANDDT